MPQADLAVERFAQGYSCAQSVFSVLAEARGLDRDLAYRLAAGFGGGVARTGGTCGCLTGALMAVGLGQRSVSPEENQAEREKTYEAGGRLIREFVARNGSACCRDLLGVDLSTPEGRKQARELRLTRTRCVKFVRDAVEIAAALVP